MPVRVHGDVLVLFVVAAAEHVADLVAEGVARPHVAGVRPEADALVRARHVREGDSARLRLPDQVRGQEVGHVGRAEEAGPCSWSKRKCTRGKLY